MELGKNCVEICEMFTETPLNFMPTCQQLLQGDKMSGCLYVHMLAENHGGCMDICCNAKFNSLFVYHLKALQWNFFSLFSTLITKSKKRSLHFFLHFLENFLHTSLLVASCTNSHWVQHCFADNVVDRKLDIIVDSQLRFP